MSMFFSNLSDKLREKFSGNPDLMQYVLGGALILVIVFALGTVIMGIGGGGNRPDVPDEIHFYDIKAEKEFVLKPEDLNDPESGMMGGVADPLFQLVKSPLTNEQTGLQMTRCPNCKKWFVPKPYLEYHKRRLAGEQVENLDELMQQSYECTHCGTNIQEYYRQKARERRGG